jgi:hypothetical protein
MSRSSGRVCRFRGAECCDEFQERSLGEDQAPETSIAGKSAALNDFETVVAALASCSVDSFFSDGFAVCLEQVAEYFSCALANADVWAL